MLISSERSLEENEEDYQFFLDLLIKKIREVNQESEEGFLYLSESEVQEELDIGAKFLRKVIEHGIKKKKLKKDSWRICLKNERRMDNESVI